MRVLAFDPGYERLGVAVLDKEVTKEVLVYSDCIRTDAKAAFPERLGVLGAEIERLCDTYAPECYALETLFFQKNQKTAMQVAEVRGMLLYIAQKRVMPIYEFSPQAIKVAITGDGRADKAAILKMVPLLVALPKKKMLDDELDAIAVGLTALAGQPRT